MRLTKLIVAGFKSFADRCEFDFEAGITCIVGPNGCGKSNVVDAIKWALGEQSAKNLRGKEMADVIFNGSDTRKPQGMAEVTLMFDNADRILPVATDTVQIGRRLFRSGESEYLINKSPARLKDIRDLFFDTGVGRTGYSIIEQGRISQFAESSPKERRVIFEEAAGISKFKVRLAEASRKLESVNANLARVGDVVDEVERRLRSVKVQAGRARTWRELSDRLHNLRTLHFRAEYHKLAQELAQAQARRQAAQTAVEETDRQVQAVSAKVDELFLRQEELQAQYRLAESTRDATLALIRQCRTQIQSGQERMDDHARSSKAAVERAEVQRQRLTVLEEELRGHEQEAEKLAREVEAGHQRIAAAQAAVTQTAREQAELQARLDDENSGLMDLIRRSTRLHSEMESLTRHADQLAAQHQRLNNRSEQVKAELGQQMTLQNELTEKEQLIDALLSEQRRTLDAKQQEAKQLGDQRAMLAGEISEAKEQRSALESRQKVLADLQRRREGVAVGPRSVLDASYQPKTNSAPNPQRPTLFTGVLGMVADVFSSDARHAGAIEATLGGLAQAVIVESVQAVRTNPTAVAGLPGRVTFIGLDETLCLSNPQTAENDACRDPSIHAGILGWATDFVQCDPRYAGLKQALLGQTLLVDKLETAEAFRRLWPAGTRWVTLTGEVLHDAPGVPTWTVGPADEAAEAGGGLISRRAELAELADALRAVEGQLSGLNERLAGLKEGLGHNEQVQKELRQAIYATNTERTDLTGQVSRTREAVRRLTMEEPLLASEAAEITNRLTAARAQHASNKEELESLAERKNAHDQAVAALQGQLSEVQARRAHHAAEDSEARQEMARLTTRRSAELTSIAALRRQGDEARRTLASAEAEIGDAQERAETAHRAVLTARGQLAEGCWQLQKDEAVVADLAVRKADAHQSWSVATNELKTVQADQGSRQQAFQQAAIESSSAQVRVENIVTRAREELNLELVEQPGITSPDREGGVQTDSAELSRTPPLQSGLVDRYEACLLESLREAGVGNDVLLLASFRVSPAELNMDWEAVAKEISDLRARLDRLGNVNLDAINELSELENRQTFLVTQRADLQHAAQQLNELIERLNGESRTRFADAFEKIRANFQAMFRKLFGGGKADILLEKNPDGTDADILEAGIEILACPPGKKNQSLSLYSGGEKAMIAVALLMSIFQSKPSPFCLLDEVDAPLDEANNNRFNAIVKEFLDFSQFVIITHSKPTMAMADRMYGVTMQEKGVSKRVGVQFDAAGKASMVADGADAVAGAA